ncbi:hypothetical protein BC828DRAFT_376433 [Blastocladiella britannica]|nr:hypothetical protein BC828DRAFT_376433 [Blastocladiella britannica]
MLPSTAFVATRSRPTSQAVASSSATALPQPRQQSQPQQQQQQKQQPLPARPDLQGTKPSTLAPTDLTQYFEIRNYTDPGTRRNCTWMATRSAPCPAGRFCPLNATSSYTCPPGFLCLVDTAHPAYCCPGFVCEQPSRIEICPEGFYCPLGSTQAMTCGPRWLAHCPPGTSKPTRVGVLGLFALFLALALAVYAAVARSRATVQSGKEKDKADPSLLSITADTDLHAAHGQSGVESDATLNNASHISLAVPSPTVSEFMFPQSSSGLMHAHAGRSQHLLPHFSQFGLFGNGSTAALSPRSAVTEKLHTVPTAHFQVRFESLTKQLPGGKVILDVVTGELRPTKLCAIMGPSGSGKSTLLHCLAGKMHRTQGTIFLNDVEDELSRYSKCCGFVPQDDTMLRELTVFDILRHSAHMRLPSELADAEKDSRVHDMMQYLGLAHVADTIIGDERVRGISGGQRRRVNVGIELVAEPSILFLDEPTSGLDSSTSLELCTLLKRIATDRGLVVAAVIHSPSQQCFDLFDDLILLGTGGHVVFSGSRRYAMPYLRNLGFVKPKSQSDPEFFLDVLAGKIPLLWNSHFRAGDLGDYWRGFSRGEVLDLRTRACEISTLARVRDDQAEDIQRRHASPVEALVQRTPLAAAWHATTAYVDDVFDEVRQTVATLGVSDPVRRTPGPFRAFLLCAGRARRQLWPSFTTFTIDMAVHMAAGVFISIGSQTNEYLGKFPSALCDVTPFPLMPACRAPVNTLPSSGMFMAIAVFFAGVSSGANTFGLERVVYWRDVASGMPTLPYFAAKVVVDIPRIVLAGVWFCVGVMFMWPNRGPWVEILGVITALYYSAFSMGYFISTVALNSSIGVMATSASLLWALVLGGVIPSLAEVQESTSVYFPFSFLWSLSAPRYAIEAIYLSDVRGRPWEELADQSTYEPQGYSRDGYLPAIANILVIGMLWQVAALAGMKLTRRDRQK